MAARINRHQGISYLRPRTGRFRLSFQRMTWADLNATTATSAQALSWAAPASIFTVVQSRTTMSMTGTIETVSIAHGDKTRCVHLQP